ncbi:glucose-6-phosphate exchanger SLC37A2-like isoform X2 [Dysidea avara]|uniref:glucose-6-phosphate exchanger SLC37A2-like isoform X2 n=1 Tax=Dysidea avara TaxID=196820 RepID=UPI00332BD926
MTEATNTHIEKDRLLSTEEDDDTIIIQHHRLPIGIWFVERLGALSRLDPVVKKKCYQVLIVVLTFCCYTTYHLTRKTISVVKSTLHPDCNSSDEECANPSNHCRGWEPFDSSDGKTLLGTLDYAWLFSYAIAMFFSGQLAERSNLRYFLTVGMLGSSLSVALFGMGYFLHIHKLYYFILVQIVGGIFQSSGWPGVVAVMANWFGKGKRGFIMGIWNCHTSVGNILGTVIPAIWAHNDWGWSFLVSSFIMVAVTIAIFLLLVIDPSHIALPPPRHHLESRESSPISPLPSSPAPVNGDYKSDHQKLDRKTRVKHGEEKAISFWRALLIPGVIEFSIALFFAKLVSYAFLFWLPYYIKNTRIGGHCLDTFEASALSTTFDVGGMIGGILAGLVSDLLQARAFTSTASLYMAIPALYLYRQFGGESLALNIILMIITGACVNGPYAMITTAVSADLGTHKSLQGSHKAKATVTAIIDGTGSIGAAVGPLLTGLLSNHVSWDSVFYLFMGASLTAALLLSRLVYGEVQMWWHAWTTKRSRLSVEINDDSDNETRSSPSGPRLRNNYSETM